MNNLTKNKNVQQFTTLILSNYSVILISFATSILMTSLMREKDYGYYRYAISIINMLVVFLGFGINYSTARLLTKEAPELYKEKILSSSVSLLLIIFTIFNIFSLPVIFFAKCFIKIDPIFLWAFPLSFTILLQRNFLVALKGNNRINDIAFQTIFPSITIMLIYVFFKLSGKEVNFETALIIFGSIYFIVHVITSKRLRIRLSFNLLSSNIKEIYYENKTNGFQLYKGSIIGVFVGELITVITGNYSDKADLGMYFLALSITAPISAIPQSAAVIKFKDYAQRKAISRKSLLIIFTVSFFGMISLILGVKFLFPLFFESRYNGALNYIFISSAMFFFHGMGDFFNGFLSSKGNGKIIRNGAYITGVTLLVFSIFLIPVFKLNGLLISKFISSFMYFVVMFYSYTKIARN